MTFAGLTGSQPILSSTQVDADGSVPHIDAAAGADVYCIAPATAGILAQLASGAADDPVALLALTVRCPVVICPAMNDAMWHAKSVQANVALLQERGIDICNSAFTPSTLLLSRPSPHCDRQTGTDARNDPSSPEGYYCW